MESLNDIPGFIKNLRNLIAGKEGTSPNGILSPTEFDTLLRDELNIRRVNHVQDGSYFDVVDKVLEHLQSKGEPLMLSLIAAMAEVRPHHNDLRKLYENHVREKVGPEWQKRVDVARAASWSPTTLVPPPTSAPPEPRPLPRWLSFYPPLAAVAIRQIYYGFSPPYYEFLPCLFLTMMAPALIAVPFGVTGKVSRRDIGVMASLSALLACFLAVVLHQRWDLQWIDLT